jgi:hypothetical protein
MFLTCETPSILQSCSHPSTFAFLFPVSFSYISICGTKITFASIIIFYNAFLVDLTLDHRFY